MDYTYTKRKYIKFPNYLVCKPFWIVNPSIVHVEITLLSRKSLKLKFHVHFHASSKATFIARVKREIYVFFMYYIKFLSEHGLSYTKRKEIQFPNYLDYKHVKLMILMYFLVIPQ